MSIAFDDGEAYERYMSVWSRRVGVPFLKWLQAPEALDWLDIGCGNGAFTRLLLEQTGAASVCGIDPSQALLTHARQQPDLQSVRFQLADAMQLPFAEASFDAAVMPLVLFFIPQPAIGVAQMVRVLRPGGLAAAYVWDMSGGGFPYQRVLEALREFDLPTPTPPSPEASRLPDMQALWQNAGLIDVQTCRIAAQRQFDDFDQLWATLTARSTFRERIEGIDDATQSRFRQSLQNRLDTDAQGRILMQAHAHAIKGRRPG